MKVYLTRDEIEVVVANYIRAMFDKAVIVSEIKIGGSGQRIIVEVELDEGIAEAYLKAPDLDTKLAEIVDS